MERKPDPLCPSCGRPWDDGEHVRSTYWGVVVIICPDVPLGDPGSVLTYRTHWGFLGDAA